ncbi:HTH domain-containing protein [Legionella pneumophila serogroup 8]
MKSQTAIIEVLRKAGKPLHAKAITEQIISGGLWRTNGKTPVATVSAYIYSDIKLKGEQSNFIKVAPQIFTLRKNNQELNKESPTEKIHKQAPKLVSPECFSFKDCAKKVLEEFGHNKPMHYKAITEQALASGWLKTEGKTPDATMYAQIITENKQQKQNGSQPLFTLHGRGYVGLSQWIKPGLALQIEQHNQQIRKALHERLLSMQPDEFEELISLLLGEMGFEMVEVTKYSNDGGIDVRGTLVVGGVVRNKLAVQVKRWKNNIQAPVVQQVRGSLGIHEQGLIITTSDFSAGAIKEAAQTDKTPIALMNGEQLVKELITNGIGVHHSTMELYEIDESFFA